MCVMFSDTNMWYLPNSNSLTPNKVSGSSLQFTSDLTPEPVSHSAGAGTQCHRMASTSDTSHKLGIQATRIPAWPITHPSASMVCGVQGSSYPVWDAQLILSFRTCLGFRRCWRAALWWRQVWCLHHCLWDTERHPHRSGTPGSPSGPKTRRTVSLSGI